MLKNVLIFRGFTGLRYHPRGCPDEAELRALQGRVGHREEARDDADQPGGRDHRPQPRDDQGEDQAERARTHPGKELESK